MFHCCEESGEGKGRVGSFNFDVAEAYQINVRPVNAFMQSKLSELNEACVERSAPRSADVAVAKGKTARALP